ncbi:MAG: 16S rRNA (uracil(1498)-N(3))-methyltransferase [Saprospiraceae bacterium]|nr:16S rRNA (uracil(1498)-N(3))-methyltransferase [Saprospiraceae bacterium]
MQLYYVDQVKNDTLIFDAEEAHHLRKVIRISEGDKVRCTDGKGNEFFGTVTEVSKKHVQASIDREINHQPAPALHIGISPTKNISRYEWFLEKAVEIGVTQITPLKCRHSERKSLRIDRLQRIIQSAAKQSEKVFFPKLSMMMDFQSFIEEDHSEEIMLMAHLDEKITLIDRTSVGKKSVLMLVGPEGGFQDSEVELAISNDFELVSLGDYRLRTETAGIVAASLIKQIHFLQ